MHKRKFKIIFNHSMAKKELEKVMEENVVKYFKQQKSNLHV